jgi:NADP-dependent 3-hydroxy acid dehydrogenase YdfG
MKDKISIVTGAGSGIGEATGTKLAALGTTVALVGRTASKLEKIHDAIVAAGSAAEVHPCDVGDPDAVASMVDKVVAKHGRVDILVNNAGFSSHSRTVLTITPEEARAMVDTNLLGPFYLCKAVIPSMLEAGQGTIVNVSSISGLMASRLGGPVYGAVKAGLRNFSINLNLEFKNMGIRSVCILPGEVDTPTLDYRPVMPSDEARETMMAPDDVADAIVSVVTLPQRALVEELIIKPTHQRDHSAEVLPPV